MVSWEEGKAPDIVFEITSWTTRRQDLSTAPRGKRTLYGRMGVREYYVYDPAAMAPPHLRAFALQGEEDERRLEEVALLPNGGVWSPLLRAELRPVAIRGIEWEPNAIYLRVIDPTTGAPIRVGEEALQDYRAAQEQVVALQQDYRVAQEQVVALRHNYEAVQEQAEEIGECLTESEQARLAAEERARRAEEALERLQAAQA